MAEAIIEGGCLCGAVRYRATDAPYNITHCHCGTCRRASGAAFVSWASFPAASFAFTSGAPTRFASSINVTRTFCQRCGTPLTYQRHDQSEEIDVTLGSLDKPERLIPQDHTWTSSKLPWIKLADGLPHYETIRSKE
jgi:hypothetical protein